MGDRKRAHIEFENFRRKYRKKDVTFLTKERRRERVCRTAEEMEPFLKGLVAMAEEAKEKGTRIVLSLDTESDCHIAGVTSKPDLFFWHRRRLRKEGASEAELRRRDEEQALLAAAWGRKSSKQKRNQRNQYRADRLSRGFVQTDIVTLQIGCHEDGKNEFTFAANLVAISDASFRGGATLPPLMFQLLSHESIVWIGLGIYEDFQSISDSFYEGNLVGPKYVDLKDVMEAAFGPLEKQDDIAGNGLLGHFQRVFYSEGWTWAKSPLITRSKFSGYWSDAQVEYMLMDVHSVILIMGKLKSKVGDASAMAEVFPVRREEAKEVVGEAAQMAAATDVSFEPFAFESSDEDESVFLSGAAADDEEADERASKFAEEAAERFREKREEMAKSLARPDVLPDSDEDWEEEADKGPSAAADDDGKSLQQVIKEVQQLIEPSEEKGETNATDSTFFIDEEDIVNPDGTPLKKEYELIIIESSTDDDDDDKNDGNGDDEDNDVDDSDIEVLQEVKPDTDAQEDENYVSKMIQPVSGEIESEDNEVEGASSDELGGRPKLGADFPSPTAEWSEVEEVDEEEFLAPLMDSLTRPAKNLAKAIANSKSLNYKCIGKASPELLARAALVMKGSNRARSNYSQLLSYLAARWNEAEKHRFLDGIKEVDPHLTHIRVITILMIKDIELELLLSLNTHLTTDYLQHFPEKVAPLMQMAAELYRKSSEDKFNRFKQVRFYSGKRASFFLAASSDKELEATMRAVAKVFHVDLPAKLRRNNVQDCVVNVTKKLHMGVMTLQAAEAKIESMINGVAGGRDLAFALSESCNALHAHLAFKWFGRGQRELEAPLGCPDDRFHTIDRRVVCVLTTDMATMVAEKIGGVVCLVTAYRRSNDYRKNERSLGAIGFTAKDWREIFIVFPGTYPEAANMVRQAVRPKQIYCLNAKRAAENLGGDLRLVELDPINQGRKGPVEHASRFLKRTANVTYCANHFFDVFGALPDVDAAPVRHLAAETHFLSCSVPFLSPPA